MTQKKKLPKILIIEEEAIIALEVKLKLESLGFEDIEIVGNGKRALEKIKHFRPNLILSEIFFTSGSNGIEIISAIKKQLTADVIFITSLTYLSDDPQVTALKPLAILGKPFRDEDLSRVLQSRYFKH